jgi:hypothetical protein
MQLTTANVRHGEHPTETREIANNTMRRSYFCDWSQRYNAVELIVGNPGRAHYEPVTI